VGEKEIITVSSLCNVRTKEKRGNENSTKNWPVASEGEGAWFDVSEKVRSYQGQWECFFWNKRRENGQIKWERGL